MEPVQAPLQIIWLWGYDLIKGNADMLVAGAGLGTMYYMLGGLPNQGQSYMQIGQAYLAGGVAVYAVESLYDRYGSRAGPSGVAANTRAY